MKHIPKVVRVLQTGHLNATNVLFLLLLLHVHEVDVLLKPHQFALYALKHFVEELRRSVAFSADHAIVVIDHCQALL